MSWQAAARGAILRRHCGVIPRSTGVGSLPNQLRRLCLSLNSSQTRPQLPSLALRAIPQCSSFATASKQPEETKKPKAKATKKSTRGRPAKKIPTRPLTQKQEEVRKRKDLAARVQQLKIIALETPKKLPGTFQALAIQEGFKETRNEYAKTKDAFREAVNLGKAMGTHERERLLAQAAENRKANAAALEAFVKSHTALEIKEANIARRALARIANGRVQLLPDDRTVKKPMNAYVLYANSRLKSGDDIDWTTRVGPFKAFSKEWSELPSTEKEKFEQMAKEESARYVREHEEVYGYAPRQKVKRAPRQSKS